MTSSDNYYFPIDMNKSTFLLYRPVMDFEESAWPYFVCPTREIAEIKRKEIVDFCKNLYDQCPYPYDENEEVSEEDYEKWWIAKDKLRDAAYPYLLDLGSDFEYFDRGEFIQIIEIPIYE